MLEAKKVINLCGDGLITGSGKRGEFLEAGNILFLGLNSHYICVSNLGKKMSCTFLICVLISE